MDREEYIKGVIKQSISIVTGKEGMDNNQNLLDSKIGVFPADYIYIFNMLEKKLGVPVFCLLEKYDHTVMTINNLAIAINELFFKIFFVYGKPFPLPAFS